MVRKLKFHEKKLLKKVDFISWEIDNNLHELKVMKKYYVQRREDYTKYVYIQQYSEPVYFKHLGRARFTCSALSWTLPILDGDFLHFDPNLYVHNLCSYFVINIFKNPIYP